MSWIINSLLILLFAVTSSKSQDNFYFDPSPINQQVLEGAGVVLRCDVSNRKHIIFSWQLANNDVRNSSRRFQEGSDLRILRVDRDEDVGGFRCIATNFSTGVSITSTAASLDIQWLTDVAEVQLKSPRTAPEITSGGEVSLKCQCNGNPEPFVIWYKNRVRLTDSERVKLHKSRLKLTGVTSEDNGVYSCEASNPAGQANSIHNFLMAVPGAAGSVELVSETFTDLLLVRRGQSAAFNCEFTNVLVTEWYYGDNKLTNLTNKYTVYSNGSLVIHDIRSRDEGGYSCLGMGTMGTIQTYVAELKLAFLEPLTRDDFDPVPPDQGHPIVVPVGGKYNIRCDLPKGLPRPTQRWESPGGVVVPVTGAPTVAVDGLLTISAANPSTSGNYTCVAENIATERRASVWIVVSEAPKISRHPQSTRVQEGDNAMFACVVQGTPYPVTTVTWTKEDKPIDSQSPHYEMDVAMGTLVIRQVTPEDKGNYACVAKTQGHPPAISFNRALYVKKNLKFTIEPTDRPVEHGTLATKVCAADGDDSPITVRWTKEGSTSLGPKVTDVEGVLTFDLVDWFHNGTYTCTAENGQGKINKTIHVSVIVKPRFKVRPKNMTVYEGAPLLIHCVVEGTPTPNIKWDKNSKVDDFDDKRFKVLKNGTLHISKVYMEDLGRYGCTAGNSGGLIREDMYLVVRGGSPIQADNFGMMKTIIIAVCSAVAYLAVVIGLTVYCSIRLVKMKNKNKRNTPSDTQAAEKLENGTVVPGERTELMDKDDRYVTMVKPPLSDDTRSHLSGVSSSHQSHSSQPSSAKSQSSYHKYSFPRHDLQTLGMLGKGCYGDVFLAKAHQIKPGETETLVVVKSLLTRDENHHYEFRREIDMFSKVNHENVVRLLGLCRDMEPQFLITEYCEWGDLKQFLWALRKDNGRTAQITLPPLTNAQKITMCSQVASGMEHLANHRFVHKDLAARNVLLAPNLDLKLANLGLCRDIYLAEYHAFHGHQIPLRWMPPEAVLEDEFSIKSDVWSFACFMYEVFSLGDLPHKTKTEEEVLKGLKSGDCGLIDMPGGCPLELWELLHRCMSVNVTERPSFSDICNTIGELTVDSDV